MSRWAKPGLDRDQLVLIETTLSDRIPEDHSVRLFWELLDTYDWGPWERRYHGRQGQPAIHPRIVAGVLLYGLTQGIRSSRKLEWACGHAVDFMWICEGRSIDHSTLCGFRRRFGDELKDLFSHLGRLAMAMGVVRLNCVAIDGTRVRANASRDRTQGAASLEADLSRLNAQIEQMLNEAEAVDQRECGDLFDETAPVISVPKELASLKDRQAKLNKALAALRTRQASGSRQKKVAVTDPEAPIVPNKTRGFDANYTPVVATDARHKYAVAETVQADAHESRALMPLLDQTQETFDQAPDVTIADSNFCTQENLASLADRPTDAYVAPRNECLEGHKAGAYVKPSIVQRPNPREPLDESLWPALPRTSRGRLTKNAFVYDPTSDGFWCPMGRRLAYRRTEKSTCDGVAYDRRVYLCSSCDGCALRPQCAGTNKTRRLRTPGPTPLHNQMAHKVHSETGRAIYRQRQWVAETPFALIKAAMGVRQFLLRGLQNVAIEWRWICTAYDLGILVRSLKHLRQKLRAAAA